MTTATLARDAEAATGFLRRYDFAAPLDDLWELIPDPGWTCPLAPGRAHLTNTREKNADIASSRSFSTCGSIGSTAW